ncbi:BON domain protein [Polystyrenella longa]|uniref:BON domain protein n=1 Tax=Polystyrenella longa TaxID=2528007 RepID=A0A518CGI5_9PLAN|nr:BON domain-containing protein [Polystyrenella longa]QDU78327.1 BON domain protein [Polystyrenella longa]
MTTKHYLDGQHSLHELAHNAIVSNPYFFGQKIKVDVRGEDVILRGMVNTYYQKQLAQETVLDIEGVHSVQNEIDVDSVWNRGQGHQDKTSSRFYSANTVPSWSF